MTTLSPTFRSASVICTFSPAWPNLMSGAAVNVTSPFRWARVIVPALASTALISPVTFRPSPFLSSARAVCVRPRTAPIRATANAERITVFILSPPMSIDCRKRQNIQFNRRPSRDQADAIAAGGGICGGADVQVVGGGVTGAGDDDRGADIDEVSGE